LKAARAQAARTPSRKRLTSIAELLSGGKVAYGEIKAFEKMADDIADIKKR
jgi:hypothetical protein